MLTLEEYEKLNPRCELRHNGVSIVYVTPTSFTKWRVDSLFEKEPMNPVFSQGCIAARLDDLVATGVMPPPDHIKIDVDGFEPKVIAGARHVLHQTKVRSLLIEVNQNLFYLPRDESQSHLGTSIYVPEDAGFACPGGPHHPFELFRRVYTMPYVPNTLFAFLKTQNSFHGVEPLTGAAVRRDLLLYDIKVAAAPELREPAPAAPSGAVAPVSFSF